MMRTKDVVLMATVTSFEAMPHPGRHELRRFAELFEPVFKASSLEARRNAVAALSRLETIPQPVAWFIASQPIAVAALFLTTSKAIDDNTLIAVAKSQGAEHARAIARREALSVKVVDALVALRHEGPLPTARMAASEAMAVAADDANVIAAASETALPAPTKAVEPVDTPMIKTAAEDPSQPLSPGERLRATLKDMVRREAISNSQIEPDAEAETKAALLVRFARKGAARAYSMVLADLIGSSRWLTDRIMMDVSGLQLATVLKACRIDPQDGEFALTQFYPHLSEMTGRLSRAAFLLSTIEEGDAENRLSGWIRADD